MFKNKQPSIPQKFCSAKIALWPRLVLLLWGHWFSRQGSGGAEAWCQNICLPSSVTKKLARDHKLFRYGLSFEGYKRSNKKFGLLQKKKYYWDVAIRCIIVWQEFWDVAIRVLCGYAFTTYRQLNSQCFLNWTKLNFRLPDRRHVNANYTHEVILHMLRPIIAMLHTCNLHYCWLQFMSLMFFDWFS